MTMYETHDPLHLVDEAACLKFAEQYCIKHECRYLSHEYYYHSNGNWNWMYIAVEDFSGRYEIQVDVKKYGRI
jgi:hypothetical protein